MANDRQDISKRYSKIVEIRAIITKLSAIPGTGSLNATSQYEWEKKKHFK